MFKKIHIFLKSKFVFDQWEWSFPFKLMYLLFTTFVVFPCSFTLFLALISPFYFLFCPKKNVDTNLMAFEAKIFGFWHLLLEMNFIHGIFAFIGTDN